jgi:hypothetical protein
MVVFGLASTVKASFGDDVDFVVVTKMAFIVNASPPFASVLPSGPPCISLFALVLVSESYQMMMSRLFPFGHDHRQEFMLRGNTAHPGATIAPLVR